MMGLLWDSTVESGVRTGCVHPPYFTDESAVIRLPGSPAALGPLASEISL